MNRKALLAIQAGALADIVKNSGNLSQFMDNFADYCEDKWPCIFDKDEFYEMCGIVHGRRPLSEDEVEERVRNLLTMTRAEAVNTTLGGSQQEGRLDFALNHIMRTVARMERARPSTREEATTRVPNSTTA
jgi:hypothetical protein